MGDGTESLADVDVSTTATLRNWIDRQIALPKTLHRVYYRRRANPRLTTPPTAMAVLAAFFPNR